MELKERQAPVLADSMASKGLEGERFIVAHIWDHCGHLVWFA